MTLGTSLKEIFNVNTVLVAGLSVASTYICHLNGWYADFPLTVIGIAVVFPIVFSISGAYKRREDALRHYGTLKAMGRAIYLGSRDWAPKTDPRAQKELRGLLLDLFVSIRTLFMGDDEGRDRMENHIYKDFSKLSKFIQTCRDRDMAGGEVSRLNQYLSKMIDSFESMKHIHQYRTPVTLRAYSKIFIFVLPVLYGPYFASLASDWHLGLMFVTPILFSIVLVSLDSIQDALENPFDQVGEDDILINAEKFVERLKL